ncbi:MAG TPA: hypothetical protein VE093_11110 [Polyangiaceae bacterium]|jgi:hypothetical protein|nr:hypothetical protein [Polyangiaceae bacterium]
MVLAVSAGGPMVRTDATFTSGRLVLARYDGCNLEILPPAGCFALGGYTFERKTPSVHAENRVLHNRAELIIQAPVLAAEIGGSLRLSEGVGLVLAENGFWESNQPVVTRAHMQGDPGCLASATHFVRIAAVGAYEAHKDSVNALEARAHLPFFGAGGGFVSGQSSFARAGDVSACFQGNFIMCSAPLSFVLAPLMMAGSTVQCPAGKVPDQRGGCMDYVQPSTMFLVSLGVEGPNCGDLAGTCEYGVEIWVGAQHVATLRGPQDDASMAPVQLHHRFPPTELDRGITVKMWDRDPFDDDWLGSCTFRKTPDEIAGYVHRARVGQPSTTERIPCGGRELLVRIEPQNP